MIFWFDFPEHISIFFCQDFMISLKIIFARAFGARIFKDSLKSSCAFVARILSNYSYDVIYKVPVLSMPLSILVYGKESGAKLNLTGDWSP